MEGLQYVFMEESIELEIEKLKREEALRTIRLRCAGCYKFIDYQVNSGKPKLCEGCYEKAQKRK